MRPPADDEINKDDPGRGGFDQAYALALQQTRHEFYRLLSLVYARYGQDGLDTLFVEWVASDSTSQEQLAVLLTGYRPIAPPSEPPTTTRPIPRPTAVADQCETIADELASQEAELSAFRREAGGDQGDPEIGRRIAELQQEIHRIEAALEQCA
jgi:hypothetical protein